MKPYYQILSTLSVVLLLGCDTGSDTGSDEEPIACTASVEPGIVISILDSQTGEAISCGATGLLQESSYQEELANPDAPDCQPTAALVGAYEREGFYNITIYKEGYEYWYAYDVEVVSGKCHVETVQIEAHLIKQ